MNFRRVLSAVAALTLSAGTAVAGLNIPRTMWQPNKDPGYCGWVSLKTLMLYHGWRDVAGRVVEDETKQGPRTIYKYDGFGRATPVVKAAGGMSVDKVNERLTKYKEDYGMDYRHLLPVAFAAGERAGPDRVDFIRKSVEYGYGAVVSTEKGAHAVVLVNIAKEATKFTYEVNGAKIEKTEHAVEFIDCNDVQRYNRHIAEYRAGKRKTRPKPVKPCRTSLEWWVANDWDGWAIVVLPNPDKAKSTRPRAEMLAKHEEKRAPPPPPLPPPPPVQVEEPEPADEEPEEKPAPPAKKPEKKPEDKVAKVPLTDIAPLIAPTPPAANIRPPTPTFPRAQPQPLLVPPLLNPKPSD